MKKKEFDVGFGNYYAGCLAYADDLTILAPSKKGLQLMIQTCEVFAKDFDIRFNGTKSQFLVCPVGGNNCSKKCSVIVNNTAVGNVDNAIHLGHHISANDRNSLVLAAKAQFWRSFNICNADFGHIKIVITVYSI